MILSWQPSNAHRSLAGPAAFDVGLLDPEGGVDNDDPSGADGLPAVVPGPKMPKQPVADDASDGPNGDATGPNTAEDDVSGSLGIAIGWLGPPTSEEGLLRLASS